VRTEINKKVLLIIPCFNEQENIGELLKQVKKISLEGVEITPLPINDCSTDNTLIVIRQQTNIYLDLPVNLGIGGAVQSGYHYAHLQNYDIAVQVDGDGQHPIEELRKIIEPILNNEADVVIGSRFIKRTGFQSSAMRRIGINYFKKLNKILLGITITDSTSGFRAINRKAIELVCEYYPDEYPEPEAIVIFKLNKLNIKEVPVEMKERQGGVSSISSFKSIYYMIKVTLGILFIYLRIKSNGKRSAI
jgi:glycosyltransferase involved in cell wall biosynthesis